MQGAPLFLYQISQADPAYVSLTVLEGRQDLGRTYRPVRAIQCAHPQFCRSINSSPKSFFQWKRKVAAKPQTSAFERVQTLEPTKEIIENKHPSGISIIVPGFRENSGTVPAAFDDRQQHEFEHLSGTRLVLLQAKDSLSDSA